MVTVAEDLDWQLSNFAHNPEQAQKALERLHDGHRDAFLSLALERLRRRDGSDNIFLVSFLLQRGELRPFLAASSGLTTTEAAAIANLAYRVDGNFDRTLAAWLLEESSAADRERQLAILCHVNLRPNVVRGLAGLLKDGNPRVRSRVTYLLVSADPNGEWVDSAVRDPDPRTRANAIEALGNSDRPDAVAMLEEAAWDPHHRVRSNALLGLYRRGEPSSLRPMTALLKSQSAVERRAGLWLVESTGDPRFLAAVSGMIARSEPEERRRCLKALTAMRKKREQYGAVPGVTIAVSGLRDASTPGQREFSLSGAKALRPLDLSIEEGDDLVTDYTVEAVSGIEEFWCWAPESFPSAGTGFRVFPYQPRPTSKPAVRQRNAGFRMMGVELAEEEVELRPAEESLPGLVQKLDQDLKQPPGAFVGLVIVWMGGDLDEPALRAFSERARENRWAFQVVGPDVAAFRALVQATGGELHAASTVEAAAEQLEKLRRRLTASYRVTYQTVSPRATRLRVRVWGESGCGEAEIPLSG